MTSHRNGEAATRVGLHHVEHVMGTAVSIDVRDPSAPQAAIEDVVGWLHHVDETFSPYRDDSTISAIGRGELSFAELTDEIRDVLRRCEALRAETGGAFDAFAVPAPNGTMFDPSGFVKGWSIEAAAAILEGHGLRNFLINAGGDVATRGRPERGHRWRIGIRHPNLAHQLAACFEAPDRLGVATSARYERGGHIIDPRRGRPADGLASATIVGPDLAIADAYATAVFVMGFDGLAFIERQPGYDAYLITNDGEVLSTEGFDRYRASVDVMRGSANVADGRERS